MSALRRDLEKLDSSELISFRDELWRHLLETYRWDLWGSARLIMGGCSDDAFTDFRAWLVSMGQSVYEAALADPDSLSEAITDPTIEDFLFEAFQRLPAEVYEEVVGRPIPDPSIPHPREPLGVRWRDDQALQAHLPQLTAALGARRRGRV